MTNLHKKFPKHFLTQFVKSKVQTTRIEAFAKLSTISMILFRFNVQTFIIILSYQRFDNN